MTVVILCGGAGTRMGEITQVIPKPMLLIGGKPILWHIMKIYANYDYKDFILCLGYKGWDIKEYFLDYYSRIADVTITLNRGKEIIYHNGCDEMDWKVTMAETGEKSMTGARVWRIRKHLKGEKIFALTYGDGVANINLKELVEIHHKSGLMATITGVHPSGRYGELTVNKGRVTEFAEKPNVSEGLINGGFMVFNREAIKKYFKPRENLILESDVLPVIAKDGQLGIYLHQGYWQSVDTPKEHQLLERIWEKDQAPWKIWQ
jgi:glucose-1-phosphate cytidylyltransferase